MFKPVPKTKPRYAWSTPGWVSQWNQKVEAARRALAEEEQKLSRATSPAEQRLAFINWTLRNHALKKLLKSKTV